MSDSHWFANNHRIKSFWFGIEVDPVWTPNFKEKITSIRKRCHLHWFVQLFPTVGQGLKMTWLYYQKKTLWYYAARSTQWPLQRTHALQAKPDRQSFNCRVLLPWFPIIYWIWKYSIGLQCWSSKINMCWGSSHTMHTSMLSHMMAQITNLVNMTLYMRDPS